MAGAGAWGAPLAAGRGGGADNGGATASAVHAAAKKRCLALRQNLETLEALEANGQGGAAAEMAARLREDLRSLKQNSVELDGLVRSLIARDKSTRDLWKRKGEGIAEEVDALSAALDQYNKRHTRRRVEEEARSELMRRAGDAAVAIDLGGGDGVSEHDKARIANSHSVLEDAMAAGRAALASMAGQRETIKGAHRKALDVLARLGVSDGLLRVAERRARTDRLLAYGGMLVITVVGGLAWWLFR